LFFNKTYRHLRREILLAPIAGFCPGPPFKLWCNNEEAALADVIGNTLRLMGDLLLWVHHTVMRGWIITMRKWMRKEAATTAAVTAVTGNKKNWRTPVCRRVLMGGKRDETHSLPPLSSITLRPWRQGPSYRDRPKFNRPKFSSFFSSLKSNRLNIFVGWSFHSLDLREHLRCI